MPPESAIEITRANGTVATESCHFNFPRKL
jgi:hypothetical protein